MNPKLSYPVRGTCVFCSGKLFRMDEDAIVCYKCYYSEKCPYYLKEKHHESY